jgi:ABC-type molybdate transport system substrate-binding protein
VCGIAFVGGIVLALQTQQAAMAGTTPRPLEVFVPWSMEKRLRRIVEPFQEKDPGTPVRFTTGTPGKLMRKIKGGGRPDVYIAMGPGEIEVLRSLGLTVPGSAKRILKQTLVLAVSSEAREKVKELGDLAKKDITPVGIGRATLTAGRLTRAALRKLGILASVGPKARTSPLRSLVMGDVAAAVIYEQCCYDEDLFVGALALRRGIAAASPLPKELCEPFPVMAVAIKTKRAHPAAATFIRALREKRAQDILHRRGEWSCPICEMEP